MSYQVEVSQDSQFKISVELKDYQARALVWGVTGKMMDDPDDELVGDCLIKMIVHSLGEVVTDYKFLNEQRR